jgi:fucose permease
MIFVGGCFGYISGAAVNIWFNDRLGFGKTIVLGAVCQLLAYAFIIPAFPFPVLACAYFVAGFGLSLQAAQCNGYVGSLLDNMTVKMGIMHGSYGLGAFTAPFASTYFAKFSRPKWPFHYVISASLAFLNVALLVWVFRLRRQEDVLSEIGQEHVPETNAQEGNKYDQIIRTKAIHFMTIFALIYIGVEVTLGGWIVTFIIHERHGGVNSGYISSGFWGGLTLGRVALIWLNKLVGEYRVIFVYCLFAIGLELTIWFVPSIIENAIAITLVGLVLGPMFPLLVQHMTRVLPRWLLTGSVGLVAGIGVAGSAALPFMTGLLAQKYGISALQPLMISMMVILTLVWGFVPREGRRVD